MWRANPADTLRFQRLWMGIKMPRKKTNVFLMNYPLDNRGSNKIKIASWTAEQKDNFLNAIRTQRAGYYVAPCAFSIHFDTYVIHARSFDRPKTFTPHISKNKPNEIIIEIIPTIAPMQIQIIIIQIEIIGIIINITKIIIIEIILNILHIKK